MTGQTQTVPYRRPDGTTAQAIIPRTAADVRNQPDVPAWVLVVLALSPRVDGKKVYSSYTVQQIKRLQAQFGPESLRYQLESLLTDMLGGFMPTNPMGLFIHRVRLSPNRVDLT